MTLNQRILHLALAYTLILSALGASATTGAATMSEKNILGSPLIACGQDPVTGFFRDGYCNTSHHDKGTHVLCAVVTETFLNYTRSKGNDLSSPNAQFRFPGLQPGDRWCLCVLRWKQALDAGVAPPIDPHCTHEKALDYVDLEVLLKHQISVSEQH